MTACDLFSWADLAVVGLAADIAGAVVLALSFSAKSPERIREEVPLALGGSDDFGGIVSVGFPQALAQSMIRQRAEARLGLVLLVGGFTLQAIAYFIAPAKGFAGAAERSVALSLAVMVWLVAVAAWKTYVPWDERRTVARMPDARGR